MLRIAPNIKVTLKEVVKKNVQKKAMKPVDLSMEDFGYYKVGSRFVKSIFPR